jgi:2-keto-4-pentenoate hydratase/2-oxohepta-3-ene-1,7-dioic acid hydratase in catechol pathway
LTKYIRYRNGTGAAYGILEGETVHELEGDLFQGRRRNGKQRRLAEVKLLCPCEPPKILAVGRNYRSHLGTRPEPANPEMFYKPTSAVLDPEEPIVIPPDAQNVHYEGELVLVMGKRARNVPAAGALDYVFGVTCGNDVSERDWQNGPQKDLQWWRAKGSDTFAPFGPVIVEGLDFGNLLLETRLNGEVVQNQYTSDLIFDCATVVSWISRWVTLVPGDVIYTGTPQTTRKMNRGDLVEVEIEGIGVLRNRVV